MILGTTRKRKSQIGSCGKEFKGTKKTSSK